MYGFGWNEDKTAAVQQGRCRVGDRVRVVDARGGGNVGDVATVTRVESVPGEDDYCYLPDLGPDIEGLFAYRLSPAFRPGDRVKLNKHSGVRACGERGTVSAVIGDNVSVRMDDASVYGTVVAFFHADNLDWERVKDCAVKPEPKFKAGDRVTYVPGVDMDGHFMTIKSYRGNYHEPAYWFEEGGFDVESLLTLAAPCPQDNEQHSETLTIKLGLDTTDFDNALAEFRAAYNQPCIVALVNEDGKPRPSQWPHVHASVDAATAEAERLARNNPGQEFAVYQRVAGRVAEQHIEMKEVA